MIKKSLYNLKCKLKVKEITTKTFNFLDSISLISLLI
jgi:hypothetical protein